MELLTTLIVICLACVGLTQYFSHYLEKPDRISGSNIYYAKTPQVLFWIAVIFLSGFRYSFCDTGVYRNLYEDIGTDWGNAFNENFAIQDSGFNLLMIAMNKIGLKSQMIIVVSALITFTIYGVYICKYSPDIPYSLLLFLLVSYLTMINGIRQVLAGAIIFLALPYLRDRKFIPYALIVLLGSTFHASALIMLPLYIVLAGDRMNAKLWIFYGCILVFFAAPGLATAILGNLLEDSTYAEYLQVEDKMGLTRLLVAMVPATIAMIYGYVEYRNSIRIKGYRSKDRLTDVLINMQLVSFGFTALGLRMVYFARLSMYLDGGFILLLPRAIKGAFNDYSARYVKWISIILYVVYFSYQVTTYKNYGYFTKFYLTFK